MSALAPSRRWLRAALIASVAVNLLVLCAFVGAMLAGPGPRGHRVRPGGPPEIALLAGGLPDDRRAELFTRLREDPALRGGRSRLRDGEAEIAAALRADPFDTGRFSEALARQRTLQSELAARGFVALTDLIATLPAGERSALADRLERRRQPR